MAVTSGRAMSAWKSPVTKSAPIFCATSLARAGLVSASPIQSTCGCRAATSPRNSPTRPAPMMASPMRFGVFWMDASCTRRARPCAGHPRLFSKDLDGRDKPGHDVKHILPHRSCAFYRMKYQPHSTRNLATARSSTSMPRPGPSGSATAPSPRGNGALTMSSAR